MTGRTLGIACSDCKFTFTMFTALPTKLTKLNGRNFHYCPLCGHQGITLDSIVEANMWDGAFRWDIPLEAYKQLQAIYMDYIRNRTTSGYPLTIDKWIAKTLQEAILT